MHDRVDPPVEQAPLGLEGPYPEPAGQIVPPAALVGPGEAAQPGVLIGGVPLPAPLGPRDSQQVRNVAFLPKNRNRRVKISRAKILLCPCGFRVRRDFFEAKRIDLR